mgnify:CR=1 FL=1
MMQIELMTERLDGGAKAKFDRHVSVKADSRPRDISSVWEAATNEGVRREGEGRVSETGGRGQGIRKGEMFRSLFFLGTGNRNWSSTRRKSWLQKSYRKSLSWRAGDDGHDRADGQLVRVLSV